MIRFRCLSVVVVVAFALSIFAPAQADEPKPAPVDPIRALIDQLPDLDRQDTGYSGADSGTAFLPLSQNERGAMLLSPRQGKFGSSDAMKSLVKLGVKAVPALLEHLSDDRKTKIIIDCTGSFGILEKDAKYTVRVGDLCYVALGQIVNRDYPAVRYVPTAIVLVSRVPEDKKLHAALLKEWGNLTAESHQKSLAKDFDSKRTRNGASVRLGYYYPDSLESLVLKQLARPAYHRGTVWDLLHDKLYPAKTANERKEAVEEFVKKHGEIARDGLRWQLFSELDTQIADEERRILTPLDKRPKARECLIDVFGFTDKVTTKDGPKEQPYSIHDQGSLLDTLLYDRSEKIDKAVRDLLAKVDDSYPAHDYVKRLAGRGYDAEIEVYLKRHLPTVNDEGRKFWKEYEAMIGWTYLHRAVKADIPELIEMALKDKLDVNAKGKDGRTALHVAAIEGNLAAMEQLLEAKADPLLKDGTGRQPVQLAAFADHPDIVRRLLVAKSPISDALTAAIVGDADRLAELLKADPTGVKARTEDGFTLLHLAAREGHVKAVGVLLAAGADANELDARSWDRVNEPGCMYTPLHIAAMKGKAEVAKLLLQKGAKVNAVDRFGKSTPLHDAAEGGFADVVKVLLDHKADREMKDEDGRTPLEMAQEGKHAAVVKLLEAK